MSDLKMTCVSDKAKAYMLTAVYNSVYSDSSLFADIELLNKALENAMIEFKESLNDQQYINFCADDFINNIENVIDQAIDDKEITTLRNTKAFNDSITGLCLYTLRKKNANQMLDHKYTFKTIIDLLPNNNSIYSKSIKYLTLSLKFRRELAIVLNEFEGELYKYSILNYFETGCICIFLNRIAPTYRCRYRG